MSHSGITEMNRKHFNDTAGTYDSKPWAQKISAQLTQEIQDRLKWIGVDWLKEDEDSEIQGGEAKRTVRVLDYACGPGMVSRALAPYVSELRGIDLSDGMVREYNTRATNQGLLPSEMFATVGDLLDPSGPSASINGPDFYNFDIAAVGLGFHHFEDSALCMKRLVERLKPSKGVLLIIDFLSHCHIGHQGAGLFPKGAEHTVAHHGFGKEKMESLFKDADCVDIGFEILGKGITLGEGGEKFERTVFMAKGRRV